jgi:hypothetical protein
MNFRDDFSVSFVALEILEPQTARQARTDLYTQSEGNFSVAFFSTTSAGAN